MTILIVAPTNAGKSTYIEQIGKPGEKVWYAFELKGREAPANGLVHYNLLFQAPELLKAGHLPGEWDLLKEPVFKRLLESGAMQKAIVVVAPIAELRERAAKRSVVEPTRTNPGKYPKDLWTGILNAVDLFAMYEQLFEVLQRAAIPVEVVYSSSRLGGDAPVFLPSDHVYVHHNLVGLYVGTPKKPAIEEIISHPGTEYQSVTLPRGLQTGPSGFRHVKDGRSESFALFRDRSFVGRSILDIGCALGDMLFRAERYGASTLVGVELKEPRYQAACRIANLLQSKAKFQRADFLTLDFEMQFDDILLMNVLHHVSDFRSCVLKAAGLAKDRLIVEYPTLRDKRFQSLHQIDTPLDHLPVVGVSSSTVDQTFVFTRIALEWIVGDAGEFSFTSHLSPIEGREVLVATRKRN